MSYRLFAIFISLVVVSDLRGQLNQDSIRLLKSKENILALYENAMQGIHHLYNGSEYVAYDPLDEEHPYFLNNEWTFCDLKYDGEWFRNVPLLFDISKQKLIASYYYNGNKMELIQDRVDEFKMEGHHFINIKSATDSIAANTGYYEILYNGITMALAKRKKAYSEKIEGTEEFRSFKETSQYYLLLKGKQYKISGKNDLLRILNTRKKELKSFIKQEHLFVKEKENSIARVAKFYDQLIAQ